MALRQVRILILDERTAVLGGQDVDRLLEMVRSLRDHGVATIFISHRLDEIFGAYNPTLSSQALAYWCAEHLLRDRGAVATASQYSADARRAL